MSNPVTELIRMCRKVGDVVEVLPKALSDKARKEINDVCGKITDKAKTKAEDLEHVAMGELGKISKETLKELAELAKRVGKDHSAGPALPPVPAPKDVKPVALEGLTKKGDRLKISVPFKFSNRTDVYLFLNYNKSELLKFNPTVYGAGAGIEHKFTRVIKGTGEVLVDTSQEEVSGAGFIKLELQWY